MEMNISKQQECHSAGRCTYANKFKIHEANMTEVKGKVDKFTSIETLTYSFSYS